MRTHRLLIACCIFALLAACGRSHVTRESGSHSRNTRVPAGERPIRVSQPKYGATAIVQRGQSVYRIATENGLTALDLALWNDIPPPYIIHPGQRLRLYPGGQGSVAATRPATPSSKPATPSVSKPVPVVIPATSNISWRWPVDGGVIETYAGGDPTRQGIDIGGKSGQPVRAAADGVVVYSGSGLVGYGELVIIKHNDQWLSAYGHNRARLVNEGQVVKAGQQVAEMGRSGASRDMLHFEIRYNGKPVDPQQYLPRR
ncbi:peptidoglycan DD-metalloendopeptidase family protein [Thermomonas sp. HDW16]|uniref:peptidoglycan DD-metalloendopeptidase family protein n=1 Tax=Thermomonas sp. HDW16 TaxID=2714945 RepID=UPI00140D91C6|nr:peptidoglycan DD-metalloendopeptidase family protein [Thermomonas sp. HDW16]QIL21133.1 peptidoglycan DD-metalloendopeptidase family protein [Thermomonas sp. HDW16]